MEVRIDLIDLDFEYKLWKNRLKYDLNELEIIKGRLSKLHLDAIPIKEDEMIKQKERIEKCNRKILIQEEEMSTYIDDFPITKRHEIFEFHTSIKSQLNEIKENQYFFLDQLNQLKSWRD